jgi:hypothetical protein
MHQCCVSCPAVNVELLKIPPLPLPAIFEASVRLLVIAIALGAIVLASRWLTDLTAPRPVARLPSAAFVQPETGIKTIGRLFGVGESRPEAVEGLRLTGVFAGSRGGGFATFHTPNGDVSVFPGDEVVPGVKLKQIERDRVILLTAESMRELPLSNAQGAAAAAPVQAGAVAAQASEVPVQAADIAAAYRHRHNRRGQPGEEQ